MGTIVPNLSYWLGRYFGMGEGLWTRVQARYDLEIVEDRREREAW